MFAKVGAVTHPSWEWNIGRRNIDTNQYRVGNTGENAHIRTQFQEFECCIEYLVGIGHLFAADNPFAGQVSRRRDKFVDHRIATSATVILVAHLFTQLVLEPVGRP